MYAAIETRMAILSEAQPSEACIYIGKILERTLSTTQREQFGNSD